MTAVFPETLHYAQLRTMYFMYLWSVHTYAALGCAALRCAALGCAALGCAALS